MALIRIGWQERHFFALEPRERIGAVGRYQGALACTCISLPLQVFREREPLRNANYSLDRLYIHGLEQAAESRQAEAEALKTNTLFD